jgi:hypothetical protein
MYARAFAATSHGYLNILKWLAYNNNVVYELISEVAACYGYIDILQWIKERVYLSERLCTQAAKNGQHDTLKWLKENGCVANYNAVEYAVEYGHLETVKWMVEQNCKIDLEKCIYLAEKYKSYPEIANYLRSRCVV